MATDNRGVGTDRRAPTNERPPILVLADDRAPGIDHVGEDTAGTKKNLVLADDTRIDRDVVLHLHAIAQHDTR